MYAYIYIMTYGSFNGRHDELRALLRTCPGNPTWKLLRVSWCVLVKSGEVMGKSCKVVPPQLELGYPINYRILYIYISPTKTTVKLDTHISTNLAI